MVNTEYIVAVCMISFNHEKYISKAIDSILAQKVNFKYKIYISDDASCDKTPDIIKHYAILYPEIFNINLRKKNAGICINFIENMKNCNAKYIALLEGDDFWIDENKLQKQYDFMEANTDVAFCYTNAYQFIDGDEDAREIMIKNKLDQNIFNFDFYIKNDSFIMPNQTLFFRKISFPKPIPEWLYNTFNLDWAINILMLEKEKAAYIDEITAMYRIHKNGITSVTYFPKVVIAGIKLVKNLDKHFNYKYHYYYGRVQWRYHKLVVFYFENKKYLKGFYWLFYCFFRNPNALINDIYFLKTLYKVTFQGHKT